MIGIHLHDVKGIDDHRAPLKGDFDFSMLRPYLKKETLMVIETQRHATISDIRRGAEYLSDLYGGLS
jgi:sugar phosphate isomerase/epimerase